MSLYMQSGEIRLNILLKVVSGVIFVHEADMNISAKNQ